MRHERSGTGRPLLAIVGLLIVAAVVLSLWPPDLPPLSGEEPPAQEVSRALERAEAGETVRLSEAQVSALVRGTFSLRWQSPFSPGGTCEQWGVRLEDDRAMVYVVSRPLGVFNSTVRLWLVPAVSLGRLYLDPVAGSVGHLPLAPRGLLRWVRSAMLGRTLDHGMRLPDWASNVRIERRELVIEPAVRRGERPAAPGSAPTKGGTKRPPRRRRPPPQP